MKRRNTQIKGISGHELKVRTKVYDAERQELLGDFESRLKASQFTGVPALSIHQYIKRKCRCHKNKLGKILAFR